MKTAIIISAVLIVIGIVLCLVSLFTVDFNFKRFGTVKYDIQTHSVNTYINEVKINTIDAEIYFVKSEGDEIQVECYENEFVHHKVSEENGTLHITAAKEDTKWYKHITINTDTPKITVYYPSEESLSLSISTISGDIYLPHNINWENINIKTTSGEVKIRTPKANTLDIKTTSGDIKLENVKSFNLTSQTVSGDTELFNCAVDNSINAKTVSGDVKLDNCDANSLYINTTSGDVSGKLLSGKEYSVATTSGEVNIPRNEFGGICKITTVSGDVHFK